MPAVAVFISPASVDRWIHEMFAAGKATTMEDCASVIGISRIGPYKLKERGATKTQALAMAAVLRDVEPFN